MKRLMIVLSILTLTLAFAPVSAHTEWQKSEDRKKAPDSVNVAGNWTLSAETPHGTMSFGLALKQDGGKLTGTLTTADGESPIEGTATKDTVNFKTTQQMGPMSILTISGRLKTDGTMGGTVSSEMGDVAFVAKRSR